MPHYKWNQVEEAISQTLGAKDARVGELKLRLKRLLVTDRRLGRRKRRSGHKAGSRYAFYSQEGPGSGVEVMFSDYEAFALLAALTVLEHGIPQATVVDILRQVRADLETAYRESRKKNPGELFDPKAIQAMIKPGMIATDNTAPVFLAFARLSGPESGDRQVRALVTVCRGHDGLMAFIKEHSVPTVGTTFFEFAGLMHKLAKNLSETQPVQRGRSTI